MTLRILANLTSASVDRITAPSWARFIARAGMRRTLLQPSSLDAEGRGSWDGARKTEVWLPYSLQGQSNRTSVRVRRRMVGDYPRLRSIFVGRGRVTSTIRKLTNGGKRPVNTVNREHSRYRTQLGGSP